MIKPLLAMCIVLATIMPLKAQTFLGNTLTIESRNYSGPREVLISLPPNYELETNYHFPVLYVTDADMHFNHIASTVHLLSGTISPMIVVGIKQQNRMAELIPYTPAKTVSKEGETFRRFLIYEVIPYLEDRYRIADFSILFGHSLGGAFVLNAYHQDKTDFNYYLSLSPTLAWGNEILLDLLPATLKSEQQPRLATYFEGQSPFPTPEKSFHAINKLLAANPHLSDTHTNAKLEHEDHISIAHLGTYQALTRLYRGWFFTAQAAMQDPASITAHYQKLSDRLGYKITPTENDLWQLTQALIGGKSKAAKEIANKTLEYYPNSKFSYVLLADVARMNSDLTSEKSNLRKAIELADDDAIRKARYQKRLDALKD